MDMAPEIVQALYLDSARLAYSVSQMAISPCLPFDVDDADKLNNQALILGTIVDHLRNVNLEATDQNKVELASVSVKHALALFDEINQGLTNSYSKEQGFIVVHNAVTQLNDAL